jgi:hypothetical protein
VRRQNYLDRPEVVAQLDRCAALLASRVPPA